MYSEFGSYILVLLIGLFILFEKLWAVQYLGIGRSSLFPRIWDRPSIKTLRYSSQIHKLFLNNKVMVILSIVYIISL